MDELYKKKYLKYKNKYLTLQNQFGGNKINELETLLNEYIQIINKSVTVNTSISNVIGGVIEDTEQTSIIVSGDKFIKFIGEGGFGCVFSPPTLITPIIEQEYLDPDIQKINIEDLNENYVAKILSCENNAYKEEVESNMLIKEFDKDGNYTPKMIFAGYMERDDLMQYIKLKTKPKNIDTELNNCLNNKFSQKKKRISHDYYGYIITTKVGKSLNQLNKDDINKSNIKIVLTSLSDGIRNFINNLYQEKYLHGDIKTPNMTIKDNKIYFIDFGLTDKYNNILVDKHNYKYPIVLNNSTNQNYPIILHLFRIIYFNQDDNFSGNKNIYINQLLETHITQAKSDLNPYFHAVNNLISSHEDSIFKNIEYVETYLKGHISQLLNDHLKDDETYTILEVYNICFLPIAKNVDIYSLSLALYHLFVNNIYQKDFTLQNVVLKDTLKLISELFNDALYNKIENPIDLANRLDEIIKTI